MSLKARQGSYCRDIGGTLPTKFLLPTSPLKLLPYNPRRMYQFDMLKVLPLLAMSEVDQKYCAKAWSAETCNFIIFFRLSIHSSHYSCTHRTEGRYFSWWHRAKANNHRRQGPCDRISVSPYRNVTKSFLIIVWCYRYHTKNHNGLTRSNRFVNKVTEGICLRHLRLLYHDQWRKEGKSGGRRMAGDQAEFSLVVGTRNSEFRTQKTVGIPRQPWLHLLGFMARDNVRFGGSVYFWSVFVCVVLFSNLRASSTCLGNRTLFAHHSIMAYFWAKKRKKFFWNAHG